MTDFTVEVTVAAVADDDWSQLRGIIDLVPGTLLIEDPEQPMVIFPVEANSAMDAVRFVDGIAQLVGLEICSGSVIHTPEADYELEDGEQPAAADTPAVEAVNQWIRSVPKFDARMSRDGSVEYA